MRVRMRVMLLAAIPLLGQGPNGVADRIRNAPLPADQRQALEKSFTEKDFARIESILNTTQGAELEALLGALEFVGGRMNQAVEAFHRSDALSPLDDHDRFTLAMALVTVGDMNNSRAELTRLNQSHPDQPLYLYWLARLDYGQRLYDEAVEKLNRVIRLDPDSVRGYDNLGLSFDMMGLTDEAQNAFQKAVALNRKLSTPSAWPPHNFGYLLLRLQRFQEAEQYLREALEYDPNFAVAHYHLGRILEGEGQQEGAMKEYKSAASLDAKLAEPLYSLGRLYQRRGRSAEAESAFAEYKRRKALYAGNE